MTPKVKKIVDMLTAAGCENLWPRFIGVHEDVRDYVAEVVGDEVILTEAGEAILASVKGSKKNAKEEVPEVVEE